MKEMTKLLVANTGGGRRRVAEVFRDFVELASLSLRQSVDRAGWEAREARYLDVVGRYSRDEVSRFPELLAYVANELDGGLDDVLGRLYMSLELGNDRLGQFFTPFSVSLLSAKLTLPGLLEQLESRPTISMHEPSCGSGGMVLALAQALLDEGINPQRVLRVEATDLDITAVHMTYVHLVLAHLPADVTHGNTLTQEVHDAWRTPALVLLEGGRGALDGPTAESAA
jgi:type I restriction-modification system DNA methylase subunit